MSVLAGLSSTAARGEARSRRKLALALGSSIATLATLIAIDPALAASTVSGGSTAVSTSTVAAGGADIEQTGTLGVTSGPAITLDSNNSVLNSGTIQMKDVSGVTGILAQGGHTGSISNSGTITIGESSTITSTDSAGNTVGPFALGSNRYGIRVQGSSALAGDIGNSGTITLQGDDSAAISVEAPLTGSIANSGTITASGSRVYGIHTTGPLSGSVAVAGSVAASGAGAQGVVLDGDVGGGLIVEGTVTSTGYHQITRSTTDNVLADENASDIVQGGPAINVGGSLGSGLLISAPPSVLPADTTADTNGDGIVDSTEVASVVTSYGSAPAIQLGGAVGHDIRLGDVGTGDSAYGLVIGGTVSGQGLRDGVSATGLQIGLENGGGAVTIADGVRVRGSVTATAYGADATALHLNSGANTPQLYNSGTIAAVMTGEGAQTAQGLVIESGASLPTILNAGAIRGQVVGSTGDATAIVDHSGTLSAVQNIGTIAGLTTQASGSTTTPTGKTVAIDVQTNTTGFSLLNYQPSGWSVTPTITGAILMGSGADNIDVEAGSITGDLTFGAGANRLTVDGGASVIGGLTAEGGTLALSVGTGTLQINSTSQLSLTSLNLGSGSKVVFTADPASGAATQFNVAGAATIASGAKIDLRLTSLAQGTTTYTLIRADQLTASGIDSSLLGTSPYIYSNQLSTDTTAGTVSVTLARKTATDLALPAALAGGYEPVIAAVGTSASLSAGLLAQTDRASFISAYNQLLPEHSGGVFRMVAGGVEAFGRPVDERTGDNGGGWLQEVNYAALQSNQGDQLGYRGWGVGLIGGYEFPALNIGSFGLTFGGLTSEIRPHESPAASQVIANVLEAGGYWRANAGPFAASVRFAADHLTATSRRAVELTDDDNQTLYSGTASGHWSGWGVTSRARVSYEQRWRALYLKPQLGLDYLQLHEDGYQEGGGGVLDLTVDARKTTELTGFAGVAIGAVFGDEASSYWSPELLLGYRDVLSSTGGSTTAAFSSGGEAFTVGPIASGDNGAVARIAVRNGAGPTTFSFEGGAEARDGLTVYDAKISAIFRF